MNKYKKVLSNKNVSSSLNESVSSTENVSHVAKSKLAASPAQTPIDRNKIIMDAIRNAKALSKAPK